MHKFGVFIVWLSGSLAAISAIFYTCGYIITLEYLDLLGLDVYLFSYEPTFYLQRGASFFAFLISFTSEFLLYVVFMVMSGVLLFMSLRALFRKLHWFGKADRIQSTIFRYGTWVRAVIYALLATLMLLSLDLYEDLSWPLDVSNVLYGEISCSQPQPSDPRCDLVHNRGARAGERFLEVLLALAVTVLLFTVAWRVTSAMRFRVLLLFPFAVVTVIYVLLVPRFYGVTIVQSTFSSVAISDDDVRSNPSQPRFFLMNKTAEAFLLWDADKQEVVWLPVAQAPLARVGRRHSLGAVIERQANAEGLSREKAQ